MKYKVLVVDDAMFMRSKLKNILNQIDCDVIEAVNGEQGCHLFEFLHPDLVILDISMPIMNGIDALEQMIKINHQTPIIMCSAIGQESQVVKAINLGAKEFITKPFTSEQITKTVQTFLKP